MALDYNHSTENIRQRILAAHDPKKSAVRGHFFEAENRFFNQYIRRANVLVAGSGLGHDACVLAKNNRQVEGIEVIADFIDDSRKTAYQQGLTNVTYKQGDIHHIPYGNQQFDVAVLNMGTIGNFDDKADILNELLRVSRRVFFDFYPPTRKGLLSRKRMYEEEGWQNVRIEDTKIVSDDGLESVSLSKKDIDRIVRSIGAQVTYHPFHTFSVMAEITKKD